jgi:hypothetical protein
VRYEAATDMTDLVVVLGADAMQAQNTSVSVP